MDDERTDRYATRDEDDEHTDHITDHTQDEDEDIENDGYDEDPDEDEIENYDGYNEDPDEDDDIENDEDPDGIVTLSKRTRSDSLSSSLQFPRMTIVL